MTVATAVEFGVAVGLGDMSDFAGRLSIAPTLIFPVPQVYNTVSGQAFRCREFSASLPHCPSNKAGL